MPVSVKSPALLLLLLSSLHLTSAEIHSLSLPSMVILGETQFPEFTILVNVNDIPVDYYDSNTRQFASRRFWRTDNVTEDKDKSMLASNVYIDRKAKAQELTKRNNHTEGVHVLQGFAVCSIDDNQLSQFYASAAYDGEEIVQYDALAETQSASIPEFIWHKMELEAVKMTYRHIYQPLCLRTLQRHLQQDKNFLLRKVHPRLRVFQKTQADSGETQVICLATGFYPRHINLSLLRDERPVPEEHLTGGELLPNGDGTYQMRKSLRVSEEELQGKHRYTCTVTHLSLDNRLHVSLEPDFAAGLVMIISVAVILVVAVTALIIIAAVLYRRRKIGVQQGCLPSTRGQYTAAQTGST